MLGDLEKIREEQKRLLLEMAAQKEKLAQQKAELAQQKIETANQKTMLADKNAELTDRSERFAKTIITACLENQTREQASSKIQQELRIFEIQADQYLQKFWSGK